MNPTEKTILYVDDDLDDRELLQDAVQAISTIYIEFADNGLEALHYLALVKEKKALPCLVILDINMPYLDGRETFDRIQEDPQLQSLPILIFSSSQNPADKALFHQRGAEYISKPHQFSHFQKIARHIVDVYCSQKG